MVIFRTLIISEGITTLFRFILFIVSNVDNISYEWCFKYYSVRSATVIIEIFNINKYDYYPHVPTCV